MLAAEQPLAALNLLIRLCWRHRFKVIFKMASFVSCNHHVALDDHSRASQHVDIPCVQYCAMQNLVLGRVSMSTIVKQLWVYCCNLLHSARRLAFICIAWNSCPDFWQCVQQQVTLDHCSAQGTQHDAASSQDVCAKALLYLVEPRFPIFKSWSHSYVLDHKQLLLQDLVMLR